MSGSVRRRPHPAPDTSLTLTLRLARCPASRSCPASRPGDAYRRTSG